MAVNRSLSAALKAQLFQPFRDKDLRFLLTFDHDSFAVPYRFVSGDPREFETLVSNGETFQSFPFELSILSDEESDPSAVIAIQNVDDRIGSTLLELPGDPVSCTLQIVMRDTPDTIEYEAVNMEVVDIAVDALKIQGQIVLRGAATEPCPGRVLDNALSPVQFR
jgi:hypothetical protein